MIMEIQVQCPWLPHILFFAELAVALSSPSAIPLWSPWFLSNLRQISINRWLPRIEDATVLLLSPTH